MLRTPVYSSTGMQNSTFWLVTKNPFLAPGLPMVHPLKCYFTPWGSLGQDSIQPQGWVLAMWCYLIHRKHSCIFALPLVQGTVFCQCNCTILLLPNLPRYIALFKKVLWILERGEGREGGREREKHWCERETSRVLGSNLQPRHVPWPGIELWPFEPMTFQLRPCSNQLSHISQELLEWFSKNSLSHLA